MGKESMQIKYIKRTPIPYEFNDLTESVGWERKNNKI